MTQKEFEILSDLLYPNVTKTVADLEKMFPPRHLPEGAMVTRFAPSPTGEVHIGSLLTSSKAMLFAKQTGGVFYLRIEDTDTKREKKDATRRIPLILKQYGIQFNEGVASDGTQYGNYGPYIQSQRKEFYHICAKEMVRRGQAYPCFCSAEHIENNIRKVQTAKKVPTGYYGRFAECRNLSLDEVKKNLANGQKFTLRFRAPDFDKTKTVTLVDEARGTMVVPQNMMDDVLIKSNDELPTYAFAHVVDDHFMRTNLVFRADEWLATWPLHVQMFEAIGFEKPKYVHAAPLMKMDGTSRKKLGKRDGVSMLDFSKVGLPEEAVMDYCMTVSFSDFEPWRVENPNAPYEQFKVQFSKMSASGALLDWDKINDISKNILSTWSAETLLTRLLTWAQEYDPEFYEVLNENKTFSHDVLHMDKSGDRVRKDIAKYSDVKGHVGYMFNHYFNKNTKADYEVLTQVNIETTKALLKDYINSFNMEAGFEGVKELATKHGFTTDMKAFRKNPTEFPGSVADVAGVIRVAVTGRQKTGDLFQIMKVLGQQEVLRRFNLFLKMF